MELKTFYGFIYIKNNVLRTKMFGNMKSILEQKHNEIDGGVFMIQTPVSDYNYELEQAIQQLETLVKVIYRRYFIFERFTKDTDNRLSALYKSIKEVENEYSERQKQCSE